jgi:hypothetical protein
MISASVVPVVIISACGLLALAFYGRLAAVVARLRGFQREMLEQQEKTRQGGMLEQRQLLEMLRTQTSGVTHRARLIRTALLFLLAAIVLLILCSLALGFSLFARIAGICAVVFFVLGLLSMLVAAITAMIELRGALHPVESEAQFVSEAIEPALFVPGEETESFDSKRPIPSRGERML